MPRLVVYLVHGTWPFGIFRKKQKGASPAWFQRGSEFCSSITSGLDEVVEVRTFSWSGKNTFSARSKAAMEFVHRLCEDGLRDGADSRYIVIAHSHGGTVCANGISLLASSLMSDPTFSDDLVINRISALICMATPFSYWVPASMAHRKVFISSTTAVVVAVLAMTWVWAFPSFVNDHTVVFGVSCLTLGFALLIGRIIFSALPAPKADYIQSVGLPRHLHVHILRAPQDEASMAIGFSQALQSVAREFYKISDLALFGSSSPYILISSFLVGLVLLSAGRQLAPAIIPGSESSDVVYVVGTIMAAALAGLLFLLCHFMMVLSVGFWRVMLWGRRTIEVDVAPLGVLSTIRVLEPNPLDENLRHALHKRPDVRETVRACLRGFVDGLEAPHR